MIGGVHATLEMKVLEKLPDIDFSVLREGEEVMLNLVNEVPLQDIKGITYRDKKNKLINNGIAPVIKDIDNLPYPERDKFYGLTDQEKKSRCFLYGYYKRLPLQMHLLCITIPLG